MQEEIENGEKGSQSWGLPGVVGVRGEREGKEEVKKRNWKERGKRLLVDVLVEWRPMYWQTPCSSNL